MGASHIRYIRTCVCACVGLHAYEGITASLKHSGSSSFAFFPALLGGKAERPLPGGEAEKSLLGGEAERFEESVSCSRLRADSWRRCAMREAIDVLLLVLTSDGVTSDGVVAL